MADILANGGWVVWPIIGCSIAVVAIAVERLLVLRQELIAPQGLIRQFRDLESLERLDASQLASIGAASVLGELLVGLFDRRRQLPEMIRDYAETAGRRAVHRLNAHLSMLATIAAIAPLLGLLGTVVGMIKIFSALTAGGIGDADTLAGGIGEALVTTAMGIGVAIPAHLLHSWLSRRVDSLALVLERNVTDFTSWITQTHQPGAPDSKRA
ncbi:MAG: MotA/TolQ/ExbB proton channel family protein [Gammaproteobacteria bacterium]